MATISVEDRISQKLENLTTMEFNAFYKSIFGKDKIKCNQTKRFRLTEYLRKSYTEEEKIMEELVALVSEDCDENN